jgi:hypothetical protein
MRILIDNVSDGQVTTAIEALENAHIPHEGGGTVQERDTQYGVILVKSALAENAVAVLREAGIAARLE